MLQNNRKTFLEGCLKFNQSEFVESIKLFEKAKVEGYHGEELKINLAQAYFGEGTKLLSSSENYPQALEFLNNALDLGFNNCEIYYNIGLANLYLKNINKAVAWFNKAIEKGFHQANCYYNLGIAYKEANRIDESAAALEKANSVTSKNFDIIYNLGKIYLEKGKYNLALEKFEEAISLSSAPLTTIELYCQIIKSLELQKKGFTNQIDINNFDKAIVDNLENAEQLLASIENPILEVEKDQYAFYVYAMLGKTSLNYIHYEKAFEYYEKALAIKFDGSVKFNSIYCSIMLKHNSENNLENEALYQEEIEALQAFKTPEAFNALAAIYNYIGDNENMQKALAGAIELYTDEV